MTLVWQIIVCSERDLFRYIFWASSYCCPGMSLMRTGSTSLCKQLALLFVTLSMIWGPVGVKSLTDLVILHLRWISRQAFVVCHCWANLSIGVMGLSKKQKIVWTIYIIYIKLHWRGPGDKLGAFSKPVHLLFTHKVLDLRCFVVNFKGDWKYLYQLFCMERYATKEEACARKFTARSAAC